jgi:pilus assembly protein CpaE
VVVEPVATTELTMDAHALGAVPTGAAPPVAVPDTRYAVAIVEPDPRLRMMLAARVPAAQQLESIEELTHVLRGGRPTVGVFGPSMVSPFGFEQVHRLVALYPELGPVFAAHELTTDLLQHALRAGARDAVQIDATGDAVAQAVARVGEVLHAPARAVAVPAVAAPRTALMPRTTPGRLIAVFSTKGGVGKSTVATNVATAMARMIDDTVTLMDADLQFGDISVMLGIPPEHTVVDAAAAIHYADAELMRNIVTRHESGLMVLPAPSEPTMAAAIPPDEMTAVCASLQGISGFVIVDLPTSFDDTTLSILESADDVLLVASMDIPSVKNLKIGMQALDLIAIAGPKLRLVLNRANAQVKLDVREIEHVLGLRAAFPVPYDIAVPLSINAGLPVVMHDPRCAASRAFEHMAASLLGPAADAVRRGRKGGRVRKSKK